MSFLETVEKARAFLERNGRVSLRALQREFNLDDGALDELIEELVEIQRVAVRDGRALAWAGGVPSAPTETQEPERAPRDYTPKHIADKILQSKSALEGERKQLTVLFADVKGSMELAEQLDPEAWHSILDRFFQILTDGVHRFEGTVNQYTGDGIMALFGAPIAHEDHAQRACYAALRLRDELRPFGQELRRQHGIDFSVRMGLNSGEVVVGKIGDDLRMDYTAQGHTVGLAERMEQLAEEGRPYLGAETASLVEGYFEIEELGKFSVKGTSEPMAAFALTGAGPARTRLDVSRARGFTRFVGRRDEMASLEAALSRALEGRGQVVGVVGEAGVGKSRLCSEFADRCRAREIALDDAHCPAHGQSVPLLPVFELLRGYFGIAERDPDRLVREKIAGRLLLLDRAFDETLPLIFDFLGVPDPERPAAQTDPEARERQLFGFVRRLVQARSEQEPTVLLVDDLHWIDAASDGFLAQLVEAVSSTRSLLLVNFRPEYTAEWTHRSYYQQLSLAPLGPDEVAAMLTDVLGSDASIRPLPALIQEKAQGNPFFTEEVIRSLVESGALEGERGVYRLVRPLEDLHVPATVQAVLAARIDRLPEQDKQVLQTAAVIGREFGELLLSAVVELPAGDLASSLSRLQSSEFIVEQAIYPVAEYAFTHPLTEQVARESQLQERRRRTHGSVAQAIEAASPDKLDEQAALLAHHWESAQESLEAARWHARAGDWLAQGDPRASVEHWRRVRELQQGSLNEAETEPELRIRACHGILSQSPWVTLTLEESADLHREGIRLAEELGDIAARVDVIESFGFTRGLAGDVRWMRDQLVEVLPMVRELGDPGVEARVRFQLDWSEYHLGNLGSALAHAEAGLSLATENPSLPPVNGFSPGSNFTCHKGMVLTHLGRLDEGERAIEAGRQLALRQAADAGRAPALRQADRQSAAIAAFLLEHLSRFRPDPGAADHHAQRVAEWAEETGTAWWSVFSLLSLAWAHEANGRWQEACEASKQALRRTRETRVGLEAEASHLALLSRVHLECGDAGRALQLAEEAVGIGEERGTKSWEIEALLSLSQALRRGPGADAWPRAREALQRALALVEETGAAVHSPFIREELARWAGPAGDDRSFERELRQAHRLFTEMGATGHAERVARELAS